MDRAVARLMTERTRARSWRRERLATVVLEELVDRIVRGEHAEGSVLPTEGELGEAFQVSRSVMREALQMLEDRGLVRIERRRGTTVQPRQSWNLIDPVVLRLVVECEGESAVLDDLLAVRRLLEPEAARVAAGRVTPDLLDRLRALIEDMEASLDDYFAFERLDHEFHEIVVQASGKEVSLAIVRAFQRQYVVRPSERTPPEPGRLERTAREHLGIYRALEAGDGELAATLLAEHIDGTRSEHLPTSVSVRT